MYLYGPLLEREKAWCGDGEVESRVGDGEEVIISMSSSRLRRLLLLPRNRVLCGELVELAWARKVRAYLYSRVRRVCSS